MIAYSTALQGKSQKFREMIFNHGVEGDFMSIYN
jgi:hypothetical protein